MRVWFPLAALLALLAARAGAQNPSVADLYRAGQFAAASQALAQGQALAHDDQIIACRLALYGNRIDEALACLAPMREAQPTDRNLLALWAEASWRRGDYAAAAEARAAIGAGALAERMRWFAQHRPYVHGVTRDASLRLERVDPLPVVKARLGNGPSRYFLVDTGGGDTIVDPSLVREGGVRLFGASTGVFGGGQTAQTLPGVATSLSLGGARLLNVPVVALDTSHYSEAAQGLPISGVIGTGVLSQFVSSIDYPGGRLWLRRSRTAPRSADVVVPMWLLGDHFIVVEAQADNHPYAALVDSGLAGFACTAPRSTIDALGVSIGASANVGANGAGQGVEAAPFEADLAIGAARAPRAACLFGPFPPQVETLAGAHVGLLISHAFLRNYAVTLDFQRMELVLSRARDAR